MLEKLSGIYYWITVIALILAGIMIAAPFVVLALVKISDGIDAMKGKMKRRKEKNK